jgi:hypothetical protein
MKKVVRDFQISLLIRFASWNRDFCLLRGVGAGVETIGQNGSEQYKAVMDCNQRGRSIFKM